MNQAKKGCQEAIVTVNANATYTFICVLLIMLTRVSEVPFKAILATQISQIIWFKSVTLNKQFIANT
ncbi:TPA: hypothetical protein R4062_001462 [Citrobacter freundii]|nr:hypothetical protein [Citrobacter freundii]HCE8850631.1 hypothetical protein [Citrobacter freundii]HED2420421.1 hypothetical protein [Citrobacter freundii]HED3126322.1 hypothetical protein [Citrobacter freundii]